MNSDLATFTISVMNGQLPTSEKELKGDCGIDVSIVDTDSVKNTVTVEVNGDTLDIIEFEDEINTHRSYKLKNCEVSFNNMVAV